MAIPDIPLTVLNPDNKKPEVHTGIETTLDITLTNSTGGDITLCSGESPSTLEIYVPEFFTDAEVARMQINHADWNFRFDADRAVLVLNYSGGEKKVWAQYSPLKFSILKALTTSSPTTGFLQVDFTGFTGNVPESAQTPLVLSTPPEPGNASLRKVLQISLDSQGSVFVSKQQGELTDPLQNTLFLNIKNTGAIPIYSGKDKWPGNPRVTVSFIYGRTSGALTFDDDRNAPRVGSAWKIKAKVAINQTGDWSSTNPSPTGSRPHPVWILEPSGNNKDIIGTGANANITFSFDSIVSFTPPGHTQMLIQFSGFAKDEKTLYDDEVFVLDVVKLTPPPTRGLVNFFSETPLVQVEKVGEPIEIPLRWAMFNVARVNLITSEPGIAAESIPYPNPLSLAYDNRTVTIPGIKESKAVFCTLQAFNGLGGLLNSQQFTVFLQSNAFVDPRDNRVYPAILLDNKLWMTENLDYEDPSGSSPNENKKFGQLYTAGADSVANPPDPHWRIPSQKDWESLFDKFTPGELMDGGSSGLKATLSGYRDDKGQENRLFSQGFFRSSTGEIYATLSNNSTSAIASFPATFSLAVRYVRDV